MDELKREFRGVWIAREIWLDKRLNALDKVILAEIDSLDNDETGCFASNEYLADFAQCSVRKITEAVSKLIKLEYIRVESFNGRTRILRSRIAEIAGQHSKICEADTQNLQPNNINNNLFNNKESKKVSNKKRNIQTYDELLDEFGVTGEYRAAVFRWLAHLNANGINVINDRLENLIIALDNAYDLDLDKAAEIDEAIRNGYKRLPCE